MISDDRQYRSFEFKRAEQKDNEMIIEGYALIFDALTTLYKIDGIEYKEIIDRQALKGVDLSDVVLNVDHTGKPIARTKNGTLQLLIDDKGLFVRADLSKSETGRQTDEEVKNKLFDKMSFAFSMEYDKQEYDTKTHTMRIKKINKIYDVSIVTFPAYEQTSVSARNQFSAEALKREAEARENAERLERSKERELLLILIKSKI